MPSQKEFGNLLPYSIISIGASAFQVLNYFSTFNILGSFLGMDAGDLWAIGNLIVLIIGLGMGIKGIISEDRKGLAIFGLILNIILLYVFILFILVLPGR